MTSEPIGSIHCRLYGRSADALLGRFRQAGGVIRCPWRVIVRSLEQFNTTTSMGEAHFNVLLSFAQFEREVTSERIRDKIGASKRKGLWVGGRGPPGLPSQGQKYDRCGRG